MAVKITRNNQSFETKATVVYSQIGKGMGLSFVTVEPAQVHLLESWIAELGGEKPHAADPACPPLEFDATKSVDHASRSGLSELILLLSRKGVLSDSEGNTILHRLFK